MTRVPELMAKGVNVAFGHDCGMVPCYGMGSGDMLEVASMGLHVAQMTNFIRKFVIAWSFQSLFQAASRRNFGKAKHA